MIEVIEGEMSILRLGPVTMQCYALVTVSAKSGFQGLLGLRRPRIEVQTTGGVLHDPEWCEIGNIWIDADPDVPLEHKELNIIHPGQVLRATLMNHSKEIRNVTLAIEGDAVRFVHWALECPKYYESDESCPDCRWRTQCRHEACERSPLEAKRCAESTLEAVFRKEGRITL
jgi:hypothetical protein